MDESKLLDDLLGEFRPELDGKGNFVHVVRHELGMAYALIQMGGSERAEVYLERIRKYIAALRGLPEFRRRELAVPIPKECFIDGSDNAAYIERAYAQLEGKPAE